MTHKLTCDIRRSSDCYDVEIGCEILFQQSAYLSSLAAKFAIIADDHVSVLYGEALQKSLSVAGLETHLFAFPHGEQQKTRTTKEFLEDQLLAKRLGRDTCIIALGGGVVTDIAGFLAATYCRGLPLVLMPTSLLGMVDAAIGGKTGVNVPCGKNLLGCIYQPKKVVMDLLTLKSLPKRELVNGIVEMIKHGLIADRQFFEYLERHVDQLLQLQLEVMQKAVFDSCCIKRDIVERDELDMGKRNLLNFGHTVGHALENLTNYSLSHGEAVAIGLLVESHLSLQLGTLQQTAFDRIRTILMQYGVPLHLPCRLSEKALLDAMMLDKKSLKGQPRFVMIDAKNSYYCTHVEESLITNALAWMNDDLCSY